MGTSNLTQTRLSPPLALTVLLVGILGLAACDKNNVTGIRTLGNDFVRMFNQERNSEPVDAQSVRMTLTPTIEPFNP